MASPAFYPDGVIGCVVPATAGTNLTLSSPPTTTQAQALVCLEAAAISQCGFVGMQSIGGAFSCSCYAAKPDYKADLAASPSSTDPYYSSSWNVLSNGPGGCGLATGVYVLYNYTAFKIGSAQQILGLSPSPATSVTLSTTTTTAAATTSSTAAANQQDNQPAQNTSDRIVIIALGVALAVLVSALVSVAGARHLLKKRSALKAMVSAANATNAAAALNNNNIAGQSPGGSMDTSSDSVGPLLSHPPPPALMAVGSDAQGGNQQIYVVPVMMELDRHAMAGEGGGSTIGVHHHHAAMAPPPQDHMNPTYLEYRKDQRSIHSAHSGNGGGGGSGAGAQSGGQPTWFDYQNQLQEGMHGMRVND
ncbi:hypothetical protein HK101_000325, partial [Irineochytrium annulatum]